MENLIKTERLVIRLADDGEMKSIIENETDEGLKLAYSEMYEMSRKNPGSRQWYAMWLIEKHDGTAVGELCFKGLSSDGSAEIGYGIHPEFRSCGYATEAVGVVTDEALSQPDVNRITAETEAYNIASMRVLLRSGFVHTGSFGEEGPLFERRK